jgi:hypothetical protein
MRVRRAVCLDGSFVNVRRVTGCWLRKPRIERAAPSLRKRHRVLVLRSLTVPGRSGLCAQALSALRLFANRLRVRQLQKTTKGHEFKSGSIRVNSRARFLDVRRRIARERVPPEVDGVRAPTE